MAQANLWMTKQPITARYGWRILSGRQNFHKGVDFAFGRGVAVSAWGDGRVTRSGRYTGSDYPERGIFVEIEHAPGIATSYHSLDRTAVSVGQTVKQGQTIGYAGTTALGATGPHLHAGLWLGGQHVDPLQYLAQGQVRTVTYGSPAGGGGTPIPPENKIGDFDMFRMRRSTGDIVVVDPVIGSVNLVTYTNAGIGTGELIDSFNKIPGIDVSDRQFDILNVWFNAAAAAVRDDIAKRVVAQGGKASDVSAKVDSVKADIAYINADKNNPDSLKAIHADVKASKAPDLTPDQIKALADAIAPQIKGGISKQDVIDAIKSVTYKAQ